jgi:hypothetical protein
MIHCVSKIKKFLQIIYTLSHQSLVDLVGIGTEFGRDDHGSIPATAIERGLEPLDVRTNLQTRFIWW